MDELLTCLFLFQILEPYHCATDQTCGHMSMDQIIIHAAPMGEGDMRISEVSILSMVQGRVCMRIGRFRIPIIRGSSAPKIAGLISIRPRSELMLTKTCLATENRHKRFMSPALRAQWPT